MSTLNHSLQLMLLLSFLLQAAAQAPRPNGRGSASLSPLNPRKSRLQPTECTRIHCRNLTGRCTSATDPIWGEARYAQFSYIPESSSLIPTGASRKSAREISNIVCHQDTDTVNSRGLNLLFVFFGQFLDHNLITTPSSVDEKFDIPVPAGDPEISDTVLPFKRSDRGVVPNFPSSTRPINTLSSAVDLVAVYGPNENRSMALLEFDENGKMTGKMKTSPGNLLPLNNGEFNAPDPSADFFLAGDHRVNENPVLVAMHTIFMREHNRLVDAIQTKIPSESGKQLFEMAKKLNVAQFQKIVYEEFYPALIGQKLPTYTGFKKDVNPTVSDLFGGAAFRVGHTMIGNEIPRRDSAGPVLSIPVSELFFRKANTFSAEELDMLLRGSAQTPAQEVDEKVVNALRNFLFTNVPGEEGFDLISLNIQRGRDHALPTFNEVRELFGLAKVTTFSEINPDRTVADKLANAYDGNVDEVEAFVGLISEGHKEGSGVGPTMLRVWEREFQRLRDGDQFFYLRTEKLPEILTSLFPEMAANLASGKHLLREIILSNSNIRPGELPAEDIFKL